MTSRIHNLWALGKRLFVGAVIIQLTLNAFAEQRAINGVVIDKENRRPIPFVSVSAYSLKGIWKFWTLPERELQQRVFTNQSGTFSLNDFEGDWILSVSPPLSCWTDFGKTIDSKELLQLDEEFVITVEKRNESLSECSDIWERQTKVSSTN